jgi:3-hydroxy-5-methyl-1-naphthoate 3-O-methyltransferase
MTEESSSDQGTVRLNELAFSFKKSQALSAALHSDLFSALSSGADTVSSLAAHCAIPEESADRLLVACAAMGLVIKDGETYRNAADVERYLVAGKRTFFGDYLRFSIDTEYDEWSGFPGNLHNTSAEPPPSKLYEGDLEDPARARAFTQAGYNSSIVLAHRLAKRFDFGRFSHWLDFAGGSGCYAIAACERHANIRVTVKDHPNVVPVTREFISEHSLDERIKAEPGNFLHQADYHHPSGFDLISYITPLHWYLRNDVMTALNYGFDALTSGGAVLIVGYMLNETRTGPLDSAFYHLQAIRGGHFTGHVPSGPEYVSYLEQVGCINVEYDWFLEGRLGIVVGWKP